ncbi:MAG TPA: hypothetical protein VGJ45_34990 [Pseudonocardiaceae bacterium]|jgi:ketosteroid isomerase-like protein
MPTAEQTKHDLATAFVTALSTKDWEGLRGALAPDVTWTLPGDNRAALHERVVRRTGVTTGI